MHVRFVLAALVLSAGLVGCGGDDGDSQAATLPPVTSSASPAATPSATAVPSGATEATPEAASSFVRFFYQQLEAAYNELDEERLVSLSAPNCDVCAAYTESITTIRAGGGRLAPYSVDVVEVEAPALDSQATSTSVSVVLEVGEFVQFDANGNVVMREAPVARTVQDVQLIRHGDEWRVAGVTAS